MNRAKRVAIGLGANLGSRKEKIEAAIKAIREDCIENVVVSSFYESKPWGYLNQPLFLNAVMVGDSDWTPPSLLHYVKQLENQLGRKPSFLNGPREIDLDLLVYGDEIWQKKGIEIPHPRMLSRDFVLIPLYEVWPDWVHPIEKKTIQELVKAVC